MTDTNPRDLHPMTNQIPIEEALRLVQFKQASNGSWYVENVYGNVGNVYGNVGHVVGNVEGNVGNVWGDVEGNVCGDVYGNVGHVVGNVEGNVGNVWGDVEGNVCGDVKGTINGREWRFIETPKGKLKRLIDEGADKDQLLEAFNQLEDN